MLVPFGNVDYKFELCKAVVVSTTPLCIGNLEVGHYDQAL